MLLVLIQTSSLVINSDINISQPDAFNPEIEKLGRIFKQNKCHYFALRGH